MTRTILRIIAVIFYLLSLIGCAVIHITHAQDDFITYYHTLIITPVALTLILIVVLKSI